MQRLPLMAYDEERQEYVEDPPDERASGRRRLLPIILGVACVALAVSNIVLATRLMELRDRTAAAVRAAATRVPDEAPAPERTDTEPATTPSASIPQVTPGPPPAPDTVEATMPEVDLPPRPAPRRPPSAAAGTPRSAPGPTTAWGRERSTASWMVQEYGRAEAEARARAAAGFYDTRSAERAYWGRVLGEIETADR